MSRLPTFRTSTDDFGAAFEAFCSEFADSTPVIDKSSYDTLIIVRPAFFRAAQSSTTFAGVER